MFKLTLQTSAPNTKITENLEDESLSVYKYNIRRHQTHRSNKGIGEIKSLSTTGDRNFREGKTQNSSMRERGEEKNKEDKKGRR